MAINTNVILGKTVTFEATGHYQVLAGVPGNVNDGNSSTVHRIGNDPVYWDELQYYTWTIALAKPRILDHLSFRGDAYSSSGLYATLYFHLEVQRADNNSWERVWSRGYDYGGSYYVYEPSIAAPAYEVRAIRVRGVLQANSESGYLQVAEVEAHVPAPTAPLVFCDPGDGLPVVTLDLGDIKAGRSAGPVQLDLYNNSGGSITEAAVAKSSLPPYPDSDIIELSPVQSPWSPSEEIKFTGNWPDGAKVGSVWLKVTTDIVMLDGSPNRGDKSFALVARSPAG